MAGVDVILDCMGASYYQRNLDSLNFDGRLFIIGFQGGVTTQADLRPLLSKRLTVQGIANSGYPLLIYTLCSNLVSASDHLCLHIKTWCDLLYVG